MSPISALKARSRKALPGMPISMHASAGQAPDHLRDPQARIARERAAEVDRVARLARQVQLLGQGERELADDAGHVVALAERRSADPGRDLAQDLEVELDLALDLGA